MKIVYYKSIIDSEDLQVYWKGNKWYPADSLEPRSLRFLKTISACRFQIEGAHGDQSKYDEVFEYGHRLLSYILYRQDIKAFLFRIEADPQVPNRVRTFKGNFPKVRLIENSVLENEVSVSVDKTLIASVVILTKSNFERVISYLGNNRKAFIMQSSGKDIFSQRTLAAIIENGLKPDFTLDYLKILELMGDKLGSILRMSGDGGDSLLNVDVFYKQRDTDRMRSFCEILLEEVRSNGTLP